MSTSKTPFQAAAAELDDAAAALKSASENAEEQRRLSNRADTQASNARALWEKKRDALMKIIAEQDT